MGFPSKLGIGVQVRVMEAPPSTSIAVPVTNDESSDARYSTERASSSGEATRLSACRLVMNACEASLSFIARYIGVSTAPGRMALTRRPWGPYSAASACVSPTRPDLLAAYAATPGKEQVYPTKVDVKMMEPPPLLSIAGIWCLAPRNALVRLVASASFQPASEMPVVGPA